MRRAATDITELYAPQFEQFGLQLSGKGAVFTGEVANDRAHGRAWIKQYAAEQNIRCEISLEEKMACGVGACLACVCQTKNVDEHSKVHNARICADGPVFYAEEVEL